MLMVEISKVESKKSIKQENKMEVLCNIGMRTMYLIGLLKFVLLLNMFMIEKFYIATSNLKISS